MNLIFLWANGPLKTYAKYTVQGKEKKKKKNQWMSYYYYVKEILVGYKQ